MKEKQHFAWQSFLATVLWNGLLSALIYYFGQEAIRASGQEIYFFAVALAVTLLLWLTLLLLGRRQIENAAAAALAARPVPAPAQPAPAVVKPENPAPAPVKPAPPPPPFEASALQLLAILQREGRLIDFLQEDLSLYEDEQIGAAVRNIHAGCKQSLGEHIKLEPIFSEGEGSSIVVPAGFDAHTIRLTGDVMGKPPFNGVLRHRGWRAAQVNLPQPMAGQETGRIVAAAEVEVNA